MAKKTEERLSGKKRKDAVARRHMVVGNILANLANLALSPGYSPGRSLSIPTAKTKPTRYERQNYPKNLLAGCLKNMEEVGLIVQQPYAFKQRCTTIAPTNQLLELLNVGIELSDIGRHPGVETIWLASRKERDRWSVEPKSKQLVHYRDTCQSNRYRHEIETINTQLNKSWITFDGRKQAPISLRRWFLLRSANDQHTFDLAGRLYGGFWMNLPSGERHKILIDGEEIIDLDFSAMFPRLAYWRTEADQPSNDPYVIPSLENHRIGAKLTLLSLLCRSNKMKKLSPKIRAALPGGWTAKTLREAVISHHPRIAHLFEADIGVSLMFTESQILMNALLRLASQGVSALPMHDGLMVKRSHKKVAERAMSSASREILGVELPIAEKAVWKPPNR